MLKAKKASATVKKKIINELTEKQELCYSDWRRLYAKSRETRNRLSARGVVVVTETTIAAVGPYAAR